MWPSLQWAASLLHLLGCEGETSDSCGYMLSSLPLLLSNVLPYQKQLYVASHEGRRHSLSLYCWLWPGRSTWAWKAQSDWSHTGSMPFPQWKTSSVSNQLPRVWLACLGNRATLRALLLKGEMYSAFQLSLHCSKYVQNVHFELFSEFIQTYFSFAPPNIAAYIEYAVPL